MNQNKDRLYTWLTRPWQPGHSIYSHLLTRANCVRVMDGDSTEGSLPLELQQVQTEFMYQQIQGFKDSTFQPILVDLASGLGTHLALMSKIWPSGKVNGIGIDINPQACKLATKRAKRYRLPNNFIIGDVTDPLFCQTLDDVLPNEGISSIWMVYGTWCTLDPQTRRAIHSLIYRKLEPGGVFLFDGFHYPAEAQELTHHNRSNKPHLLREETYWSGWGGFWGFFPRKVQEQSWIFSESQLFVDIYWVGLNKPFVSWRQSIDPTVEIQHLNHLLLEDYNITHGWKGTSFYGSFGLGLSPEISLEPPDPIRKAWPLEEDSQRSWQPGDPWFTLRLEKT